MFRYGFRLFCCSEMQAEVQLLKDSIPVSGTIVLCHLILIESSMHMLKRKVDTKICSYLLTGTVPIPKSKTHIVAL